MSGLLLWLITAVFLLLGLVGTILPGLPGVALAFVGILIYAIGTGFSTIAPSTVVIFGIISLLAWLVSYAGSVLGARAGGGQRKALLGALLGALIGLLGGPSGIFVGAFLGSFMGALLEGKSQEKAMKVAVLSTLGILGANVMQFLLAVIMIISFLVAVTV